MNDKNLDGMFRLILLIYCSIIKKKMSEFIYDDLKNSMIVNVTKNLFLQQVEKTELIN